MPIKIMIDYKWKAYARGIFLRQFRHFLCFVSLLVLTIILQDETDTFYRLLNFSLDCLALVFLLILSTHEYETLREEGIRSYLTDFWNYIDLGLLTIFLSLCVFDGLDLLFPMPQVLKTLMLSATIVLTFMKLNFFLRIYENFSTLVSMLQIVFGDLVYFLSFFGFVIFAFGLLFSVLLPS